MSPEPWSIKEVKCDCGNLHRRYIVDANGQTVLLDQMPDDLQRVIACVNACAGIPTEDLWRVQHQRQVNKTIWDDKGKTSQ